MINSIIFEGRLGQEPDVRFTTSGAKVANLSVANTRRYKQGEEWKSETVWVKVEGWGRLAEKMEDLSQGDRIIITGRLAEEQWETKDGQKRSKFKIVATDFRLIDTTAAAKKAVDEIPEDDYEDYGEDVPF